MKLNISAAWTKTGRYKNKWYLIPIEFPASNPMAEIHELGGGFYKTPRCFGWYIHPIDGSDTIDGTAPTLNAAKQAVRRAMKKARMI